MPVSIAAASASLKTAWEIAKAVKDGSTSLVKAELQLKLADMLGALAGARSELVDVQDELASKDREIALLRDALAEKATLVRMWDAYYRTDGNGKARGDPLCARCWEADHMLRSLVNTALDMGAKQCPACKQTYNAMMTPCIE